MWPHPSITRSSAAGSCSRIARTAAMGPPPWLLLAALPGGEIVGNGPPLDTGQTVVADQGLLNRAVLTDREQAGRPQPRG